MTKPATEEHPLTASSSCEEQLGAGMGFAQSKQSGLALHAVVPFLFI